MSKHYLESQRDLAVLRETEQGIDLILSGLAAYQTSKVGHDHHVTFLTQFGAGFERIMKMLIFYHALEVEGVTLTEKDMKKFGHWLKNMRTEIIRRYYTPILVNKYTFIKADLEFLENDKDFLKLFEILHDFNDASSPSGRYNFIKIATAAPDANGEWPERRWQELEESFTEASEYLINADNAKKKAISKMISLIERFVRALWRVMNYSESMTLARSAGTSMRFNAFKKLSDADLGKNIYKPLEV